MVEPTSGVAPANPTSTKPEAAHRRAFRALMVESINEGRLKRMVEHDKELVRPFAEQFCELWGGAIREAHKARAWSRPFDEERACEAHDKIAIALEVVSRGAVLNRLWYSSLAHAFARCLNNLFRYAKKEIQLESIPSVDIPADAIISFVRGNGRERGTFKPEDFLKILDCVCLPREFWPSRSSLVFVCQVNPSSLRVTKVGGLLEAVVSQLITNAQEAANGAAGTQHIFVAEKLLDNGDLEIQVRDEGTGIRPEVLPRIFERGFSTKGEHRGTGLSSAKELMEMIGGSIRVESVLGEGTTFTLTVPNKFVKKAEIA